MYLCLLIQPALPYVDDFDSDPEFPLFSDLRPVSGVLETASQVDGWVRASTVASGGLHDNVYEAADEARASVSSTLESVNIPVPERTSGRKNRGSEASRY